jgi:Predicted Fe-S oxidoreductase
VIRKVDLPAGEPFLYPKLLSEVIVFCKEELKLESLSIVSNGSMINENFLRKYALNIDILTVSCDSFDERLSRSLDGVLDTTITSKSCTKMHPDAASTGLCYRSTLWSITAMSTRT